MRGSHSRPYSWALVVATCDREELVPRCLRLGAEQTRPPAEIIVVDSSAGWERTRDEVLRNLAPDFPTIRWQYLQADRRSLPAQRNQGIRAASTDVVFLIDDDSLMYPDCAEHIMRIYQADTAKRVVGVNASNVPDPPDAPPDPALTHATEHTTAKRYGRVAALVRKVLRADDIFLPYDGEFPTAAIPEEVAALPVSRWRLAAGWGMTFRREVCLAVPFEELLIGYAATEDSDMSYRATRRGAYVGAYDAHLCHLGASTGRLPTFVWATLNTMNPLVLHAIHCSDRTRSRDRCRRMLARRVLLSVAKDVYYRRWRFPTARGTLVALSHVDAVFQRSESELRAWYPQFQHDIVQRYGR